MNRRKGVPCGCDADPCGCSPRNHCVKTINNESPDPNGDLVIQAGAGIGIAASDFGITITNTATPENFTEGKNIEFNEVDGNIEIGVIDDPVIDGTLTVNGDIIQNGAAYETHAEKVFTKDDYIVMRDGAVGALAAGDYSGFQVEKYDGTNDGRLVIDRDGVARVGDVNDEQPLMTRDESSDLTDGGLLAWDAIDQKAVTPASVHADTADTATSADYATNANVAQYLGSTTDDVGSDAQPMKIVDGKAVSVTDPLQKRIAVARCLSVTNNIPANAVTSLTFTNNLTSDSDVMTVSNGVVTIKKPGMYLLIMNLSGSISAASRVQLSVKRDGTSEYMYSLREITRTSTNQGVIAEFFINETTVNHTYQMEGWVQSGSMSTSNAGSSTNFNVVYLG